MKKETKARRRHSVEFKKEAVRQLESRGDRTVADVALGPGISPNQLHAWRGFELSTVSRMAATEALGCIESSAPKDSEWDEVASYPRAQNAERAVEDHVFPELSRLGHRGSYSWLKPPSTGSSAPVVKLASKPRKSAA